MGHLHFTAIILKDTTVHPVIQEYFNAEKKK